LETNRGRHGDVDGIVWRWKGRHGGMKWVVEGGVVQPLDVGFCFHSQERFLKILMKRS